MLIGLAALEEDDDQVIGYTVDLTEQKHAEEALHRAKSDAEDASKAKDRFLAILSHELRTPLTPVATALYVLAEEQLPESTRSLLELIERNVDVEVRLIDDLLDLTRITNNKLQLDLHTVDLHEELRHAIETIQSNLLEKEQRLVLHFRATNPCVKGDTARLQRIFWNLLKNAVKFTERQGTITVVTKNHEPGKVEVRIIDTGIGMNPDVVTRIFSPFEQGETSMSRQFGGLGLGLSISQMLVDMHGGVLRAESEGKDRGATFVVVLDTMPNVVSPAVRKIENGTDTNRRRKGKILIVEDHADTTRVMKLLLERSGYEVITADSVHAALSAAALEPFDLLISDIGLPDGSGLDLIRQLRQRGPVRGIAMSGMARHEDLEHSREAGFAAYMVKPIHLKELYDTIQTIMSSPRYADSQGRWW